MPARQLDQLKAAIQQNQELLKRLHERIADVEAHLQQQDVNQTETRERNKTSDSKEGESK